MLADTIKLPNLRDYQLKGLDLLRLAFKEGHRRIALDAATGSGKGVWYLHLVQNALDKNRRVLLVMKRRPLVFQTSERFTKSGIRNSIVMGNEKGFNPAIPFQICSIDTVSQRDQEFFKTFDMVIVDEGHDTTSPTYRKFFSIFPEGTPFIGLSATWFKIGNKYQDFWDCAVRPIEITELVERGYLVPCELFVPDTKVDLNGIKISSLTGDYETKELSKRSSKLEVIGDVIACYRKFADGLPAMTFCVDKAHALSLCDEFNYNGIPTAYVDDSTSQKERDRILRDFREGKLKNICQINVFSTGTDVPEMEVGLMCRPTRSEVTWIQQTGRPRRPYRKCGKCSCQYDNSAVCPTCGWDKPSYIKKSAKIIDFGNNRSRLGHPDDMRYPQLKDEGKEKLKEREEKMRPISKVCKKCFRTFEAKYLKCPYPGCDEPHEELPAELYKTKKGEIIPYDLFTEVSNFYNRLLDQEKYAGWKPNAKYLKLYDKFGEKCMKFSAEFEIPGWVPSIHKKNKEKEIGAKFYK